MDDDFAPDLDDHPDDAWADGGWGDDEFGAAEYEEFIEREFGESSVAAGTPRWVQATAWTVIAAMVLALIAAMS